MRIEVGQGLEGALTDAISNRIISETITPAFREGNFYGGIERRPRPDDQGDRRRAAAAAGTRVALRAPWRTAPASFRSCCSPFSSARWCCAGSSGARSARPSPAWARASWCTSPATRCPGRPCRPSPASSSRCSWALPAAAAAGRVDRAAARRWLGRTWRRLRWGRFRGRRRRLQRRGRRLQWRRRLGQLVERMGIGRLIRHLFTTRWRTRRHFPRRCCDAIEQAISECEGRHGGEIRFVVETALRRS